MNCSKGDIDENDMAQVNAKSYFLKADGTAKKFLITNTEFRYNGAIRQELNMLELPL